VLDQVRQSTPGGFFSFGRVWPVPFFIDPPIAFGDQTIISATGESAEYRVFSSAGALTRVVRWKAARQRVTPRDIEAARDSIRAAVRDPAEQSRLLSALDRLALPTELPALDKIVTDGDSAVWVRAYQNSVDQGERWMRFDGDGRLRGTLTVAAGQRIATFAREHCVLVTELPDTGLQRLELRRVERNPNR
jgi:hypothetical protein